jgi:G3E family GTPase
MRVNLLFGFLGSGKTTLVRRILAERGGDPPMAVIVNEFGEVGVDGDIIAGANVNVVELTSGCLCCTLRGSLMSAVEELREKAGVERIVVEATGVASPGDMLEDLADSRVQGELDVGPVVTVIDAPKFTRLKEMLGDFYEEQVENADVLLLNKIDLAGAGELAAAEAAVRAINPDALLLFAEQGDTDLALLLDGPGSELLAQIRAEKGQRVAPDGHAHTHAPAESCVLDVSGDLDGAALRAAFAGLGDTVWRAKGFAPVDARPSLVQYTMGQLEIADAPARDRAYLVVIGHGMDRAAVRARLLAACRERA